MIKIRKYQDKDFESVRKICMDTAKGSFSIKPAKREAVAKMYIDYNLKYEPEHCFVAVDENDVVCGYCAYSCDMQKLQSAIKYDIAKQVSEINILYSAFLKICTKTSVKLSKFYGGGGFHLNIDNSHQGLSVGPMLLAVMGKHLQKLGYKQMYLVTENRKTRGYGFYMHYGFEESKKCGMGTLCLTFDLQKIDEKLKKYNIDFDEIEVNNESKSKDLQLDLQ
ncbi:MAG: hypothetical protein ACI4TI_01040 [Christensenellales bacterium]